MVLCQQMVDGTSHSDHLLNVWIYFFFPFDLLFFLDFFLGFFFAL
jgi:hypothetical protein